MDDRQTRHEPTGWQPMETAPRDGTRVLLHDPARMADEGFTAEDGNMLSHVVFIGAWDRMSAGDQPDWFSDDVGDLLRPTHWMPLPEPPHE